MKLTIERAPFQAALKAVMPAVCKRGIKPVLTHVRIEANGETSLTATNTEITSRVVAEGVEIQQGGVVLLPAQRLGQLLNEVSDKSLSVASTDSGVEIRGERSRFKMPTEPPENFPLAEPPTASDCYEVDAGALLQAIRRTAFACNDEDSRYAFGGTCFEFDGRKLSMVATDGRAMALCECKADPAGKPKPGGQTIIPAASLAALSQAFGSMRGTVKVFVSANVASFDMEGVSFSTRLLEGRFPKWQMVLDKITTAHECIECVVGPFMAGVRQASLANSREKDSNGLRRHVGIDLSLSDGQLGFKASTDIGEAEASIPVSYDGKPRSVSVDPDFLTDYLRAFDPAASFEFFVLDGNEACECRCDGSRYVIMPLSRN